MGMCADFLCILECFINEAASENFIKQVCLTERRIEFVEEYQCVIEVWLWLLGMTRF